MNELTLAGKVVFIQGAGRPPGPSLALGFARLGARVAACDLSPILLDPLEATSSLIRAYVGDTSRGMPARAILDEVVQDWGRIDILVNNPRVAPLTSIMDTDDYDWQRTIDANLNGAFMLTRLASRLMREQGGGVILNIVEEAPEKTSAAYAASQAGLLAFAEAAAAELIAYNIHVYALCMVEHKESLTLNAGAALQPEGQGLVELALDLSLRGTSGEHQGDCVFKAVVSPHEHHTGTIEE